MNNRSPLQYSHTVDPMYSPETSPAVPMINVNAPDFTEANSSEYISVGYDPVQNFYRQLYVGDGTFGYSYGGGYTGRRT
jgi:hypothetical protein